VGRLVVPGSDPYVVPVNYVVVGETVVYRSDEGSPLSRLHGQAVVFEVDVLDDREHGGWSVVVRGMIDDVTHLEQDLRENLAGLEPWAPGPKDRWLRLTVGDVTGRWLRGAEQPPGTDPRGYL
jgi:nitroimidazol reductase NimA-like FMN-containing flavoprotein (pyridoxamine 5'-phosphate oxidase superfamily)